MACTKLVSATKLTECPENGLEATYRWVREGEYLYVEGGGCVTLSDIYQNLEDAPLVPMTQDGDEIETETG